MIINPSDLFSDMYFRWSTVWGTEDRFNDFEIVFDLVEPLLNLLKLKSHCKERKMFEKMP